jgi:hypothetical protein
VAAAVVADTQRVVLVAHPLVVLVAVSPQVVLHQQTRLAVAAAAAVVQLSQMAVTAVQESSM